MSNAIYFDLETDGLDANAQIIQIAAVAVDGDLAERGAFSRLVQFDESKASPEALKINHYDRERWRQEAVPVAQALAEFFAFAKPFADQVKMSKAGRPYKVGILAGYNAAKFDMPILQYWSKQTGAFMPFDFRCRDAFLVAMSVCDFLGHAPSDYKLATLANLFGVEMVKAHDAVSDVRATVALMRVFRDRFAAQVAA